MQVIQLAQVPAQRVKCVLNEQQCTITVYDKCGKIFLDLKVGTAPIISGIICYPNEVIIHIPRQNFSGNLIFLDIFTAEKTESIDYNQFQSRYFLCYASDAEYPKIGGA